MPWGRVPWGLTVNAIENKIVVNIFIFYHFTGTAYPLALETFTQYLTHKFKSSFYTLLEQNFFMYPMKKGFCTLMKKRVSASFG